MKLLQPVVSPIQFSQLIGEVASPPLIFSSVLEWEQHFWRKDHETPTRNPVKHIHTQFGHEPASEFRREHASNLSPDCNDELMVVASIIHKLINSTLGFEVASDQPLLEAGFDSLGAVELRNNLSSYFKIDMPPTLLFDYPTVAALSSFVSKAQSVLAEGRSEQSQHTLLRASSVIVEHCPEVQPTSAVVAVACRCPTFVNDLDSFQNALQQAEDLTEVVPLSRWNVQDLYSPHPSAGRMYTRFASFVNTIDKFDCQVSPFHTFCIPHSNNTRQPSHQPRPTASYLTLHRLSGYRA